MTIKKYANKIVVTGMSAVMLSSFVGAAYSNYNHAYAVDLNSAASKAIKVPARSEEFRSYIGESGDYWFKGINDIGASDVGPLDTIVYDWDRLAANTKKEVGKSVWELLMDFRLKAINAKEGNGDKGWLHKFGYYGNKNNIPREHKKYVDLGIATVPGIAGRKPGDPVLALYYHLKGMSYSGNMFDPNVNDRSQTGYIASLILPQPKLKHNYTTAKEVKEAYHNYIAVEQPSKDMVRAYIELIHDIVKLSPKERNNIRDIYILAQSYLEIAGRDMYIDMMKRNPRGTEQKRAYAGWLGANSYFLNPGDYKLVRDDYDFYRWALQMHEGLPAVENPSSVLGTQSYMGLIYKQLTKSYDTLKKDIGPNGFRKSNRLFLPIGGDGSPVDGNIDLAVETYDFMRKFSAVRGLVLRDMTMADAPLVDAMEAARDKLHPGAYQNISEEARKQFNNKIIRMHQIEAKFLDDKVLDFKRKNARLLAMDPLDLTLRNAYEVSVAYDKCLKLYSKKLINQQYLAGAVHKLKLLNDRITEIENVATPTKFLEQDPKDAKAYMEKYKAVLALTSSTISKNDAQRITNMYWDYLRLSPGAKYYVGESILKVYALMSYIDEYNAYIKAHAVTLDMHIDDVEESDRKEITNALWDYSNASITVRNMLADDIARVRTERNKLDSRSTAEESVNIVRRDHEKVLGLNVDNVTPADIPSLRYAQDDFNSLPENERAVAKADIEHIKKLLDVAENKDATVPTTPMPDTRDDNNSSSIPTPEDDSKINIDISNDSEKVHMATMTGDAFRQTYADLIDKTVNTVTLNDLPRLKYALLDYNLLDDSDKGLLGDVYLHLQKLRDRCLQIQSGSVNPGSLPDLGDVDNDAVSAFRTKFRDVLNLNPKDVTIRDEKAIENARAAFDNLSIMDKLKALADGHRLSDLESALEKIKDTPSNEKMSYDQYMGIYKHLLDRDINSLVLDDEALVNRAYDDYHNLSIVDQLRIYSEGYRVDDFKKEIEFLKRNGEKSNPIYKDADRPWLNDPVPEDGYIKESDIINKWYKDNHPDPAPPKPITNKEDYTRGADGSKIAPPSTSGDNRDFLTDNNDKVGEARDYTYSTPDVSVTSGGIQASTLDEFMNVYHDLLTKNANELKASDETMVSKALYDLSHIKSKDANEKALMDAIAQKLQTFSNKIANAKRIYEDGLDTSKIDPSRINVKMDIPLDNKANSGKTETSKTSSDKKDGAKEVKPTSDNKTNGNFTVSSSNNSKVSGSQDNSSKTTSDSNISNVSPTNDRSHDLATKTPSEGDVVIDKDLDLGSVSYNADGTLNFGNKADKFKTYSRDLERLGYEHFSEVLKDHPDVDTLKKAIEKIEKFETKTPEDAAIKAGLLKSYAKGLSKAVFNMESDLRKYDSSYSQRSYKKPKDLGVVKKGDDGNVSTFKSVFGHLWDLSGNDPLSDKDEAELNKALDMYGSLPVSDREKLSPEIDHLQRLKAYNEYHKLVERKKAVNKLSDKLSESNTKAIYNADKKKLLESKAKGTYSYSKDGSNDIVADGMNVKVDYTDDTKGDSTSDDTKAKPDTGETTMLYSGIATGAFGILSAIGVFLSKKFRK